MSNSNIIFDFETGPLPDEIVRQFLPEFTPPPHPGEFNPQSVKCGNIKDPAKIAEKIDQAKFQHARDVASYESDVAAARENHWAEFLKDAALRAHTGRIVAIGVLVAEKGEPRIVDADKDEAKAITSFWGMCSKARQQKLAIVGHNSHGFDLPFIVRRSRILAVDVPDWVRVQRRWWAAEFVDTMQEWLCGQRPGEVPASLDVVAKALGVGSKDDGGHGGVKGAEFAKLWCSGVAEERERARRYLENDLRLTASVATRLGVL